MTRPWICAPTAYNITPVASLVHLIALLAQVTGQQLDLYAVKRFSLLPEWNDLWELIRAHQVDHFNLLQDLGHVSFLQILFKQVQSDCAIFSSVETENDFVWPKHFKGLI